MTTSLNPNAEVFHSSQPVTSSAAAIDTPSTHWTDPLAPDLAVTNISTGSNPEYVSCVGNGLLIFFQLFLLLVVIYYILLICAFAVPHSSDDTVIRNC